MSTPMLTRFIGEIRQILESQNGEKLQQYLHIEPPFSEHYLAIISELRQHFPASSTKKLEKKCEADIPEYDRLDDGEVKGGSWPAFINFLLQYFAFIRDVDASKLVETQNMIKELLSQSSVALSDMTMGVVVLPTVIGLSKHLSRLSIGLEKHPELLTQSKAATTSDTTLRLTLVESAANTIRETFSKCLSSRSSTPLNAPGPPTGRRAGIYLLANLCLRLFFHCRQLRSAEQVFANIYAQSPPLSRFPASQRVTFLYYLGRYHLANGHFFRAQETLQAAYTQCHSQCLSQRRAILILLITCNIILGRFPSQELLARPEAQKPAPLGDIFSPVCTAIRRGDLHGLDTALDSNTATGAWLLQRRILLPLRNRCEVLTWRSLARRVFLVAGFKGDGGKGAPRLDVEELRCVVDKLTETSPANNEWYVDDDLAGGDDEAPESRPGVSWFEAEAAVASLVRQGLLHGYMSHKHGKFVITGAKARPAIEAGFPNVWSLLSANADKEVPGWVTETSNGRPKVGGTVIRGDFNDFVGQAL